jgi:hypothetical protein
MSENGVFAINRTLNMIREVLKRDDLTKEQRMSFQATAERIESAMGYGHHEYARIRGESPTKAARRISAELFGIHTVLKQMTAEKSNP